MATKLIDMVRYLFSKNAGPYLITFDVVFENEDDYNRVCQAKIFTRDKITELFNISPERVLSIYEYDAGRVIKFTLIREISSGDFGDSTVFGSQLWAPLIEVEVPDL